MTKKTKTIKKSVTPAPLDIKRDICRDVYTKLQFIQARNELQFIEAGNELRFSRHRVMRLGLGRMAEGKHADANAPIKGEVETQNESL